MMKKKVKEILNKLQPSHIAWLLAGVLLAEGFNWLLYKDIKRVTAPGLSSLIAVCALVLAIYSAFQVKKWMDNKVNEKGFKKCEELVEYFEKLIWEVSMCNTKKNRIILSYDQYKEKKDKTSEENLIGSMEEWNKQVIATTETYSDIYLCEKTLRLWNFSINDEYQIEPFRANFLKYRKTVKKACRLMLINNKDDEDEIKNLINEMTESFNNIKPYFRKFSNSSFYEIFQKTTSPSKKVE